MGLKFAATRSIRLAMKGIKVLYSLKLYCQGKGDMGEERHWYKEPGWLKFAVGW